MSDSVQPHRWQPTTLPHPWDSPGKNTGVGCHFLLQCMKVKSESEVAQSCLTLSDPMDYSTPGSSIHGILQFYETDPKNIAIIYICLPMFSTSSFMVSGLTFNSLIHFEFILVYGVRRCSNSILL